MSAGLVHKSKKFNIVYFTQNVTYCILNKNINSTLRQQIWISKQPGICFWPLTLSNIVLIHRIIIRLDVVLIALVDWTHWETIENSGDIQTNKRNSGLLNITSNTNINILKMRIPVKIPKFIQICWGLLGRNWITAWIFCMS